MLCHVKNLPRLKIIQILLKNKLHNFNLLEMLQVNMAILESSFLKKLIIEILQLPQSLDHSLFNINFQKALNCLFPCIHKLLLCVFIMNMKMIKWYMVGFKKILDVNLQNMCTIYYMTILGQISCLPPCNWIEGFT